MIAVQSKDNLRKLTRNSQSDRRDMPLSSTVDTYPLESFIQNNTVCSNLINALEHEATHFNLRGKTWDLGRKKDKKKKE